MRIRKKRNGERRLAACAHLLVGSAAEAFGAGSGGRAENITGADRPAAGDPVKRPLHLEIGCGKGRFITETALRHPECDFIAMELVSDVIMLAMERASALEGGAPANLRFINGNAENIEEYFAPGSVDRIYLNFSDPWHKNRHAKRRLTYSAFLARYEKILAPGGDLVMKTDNDALFDFSLEQFDLCAWQVVDCVRDLHGSPLGEGNVMTEYEEAFSSQGKNISYLRATPRK